MGNEVVDPNASVLGQQSFEDAGHLNSDEEEGTERSVLYSDERGMDRLYSDRDPYWNLLDAWQD